MSLSAHHFLSLHVGLFMLGACVTPQAPDFQELTDTVLLPADAKKILDSSCFGLAQRGEPTITESDLPRSGSRLVLLVLHASWFAVYAAQSRPASQSFSQYAACLGWRWSGALAIT